MADFSLTQQPTTGFFAPTRFEADVLDCVTTGTIPPELDGAFYRLHGDWLYPPLFSDESSLSADGFISRLRFKNGMVDYRARYVRTDRYNQQIAARRQLYGYYRNPYTDDPAVRDTENPHLRTSANTTPVILGRKLYATKEEGLPYEIDPNTLETLGVTDFGGAWSSQTFTAHPKYDPSTGETLAFGYEATGLASRDVYLYAFDKAGNITWEVRFEVPYPSMMHDMAITRDHVIIPGGGTVSSIERLQDGRPHWGWDHKLPSYHCVIPRNGKAEDVRIFYGKERSIVHTANAWSDGDTLVMDAAVAGGNTWPWFEDIHGEPFRMNTYKVRRYTYDLRQNSDQVEEQVLFDTDITSFTRIDDRYAAKPNRYIYVQYEDPTQPFDSSLPEDPRLRPVNSFAKFDLQEGTMQSYFAGPTIILQEPNFIPRSPDAPEGDGWLMGTAHNLKEYRTEVVIVDAVTMTECGRVILPFRNAYQIHGTWTTPADLPLD